MIRTGREDEAARQFNARGIAAPSVNQVAKRVGLTRAAVYYYVKDGEDLVFQCYLRACQLTADDLAELIETFKRIYADETGSPFPQDARAQLEKAVRAVFGAGALVALCSDGAGWVSGNVIGVDGAEDVAGGR